MPCGAEAEWWQTAGRWVLTRWQSGPQRKGGAQSQHPLNGLAYKQHKQEHKHQDIYIPLQPRNMDRSLCHLFAKSRVKSNFHKESSLLIQNSSSQTSHLKYHGGEWSLLGAWNGSSQSCFIHVSSILIFNILSSSPPPPMSKLCGSKVVYSS